MAGAIHRLSSGFVQRAIEPGLYPDGGGLFLQVTSGKDGTVRRSWVVRARFNGKVREMGLGVADAASLSRARKRAAETRVLAKDGIDPIVHRDALRAKAVKEAARVMTFKQCGEAYVAAHERTWKSAKHRQQWANTLATYVYPVFGDLPVQAVDVTLVMKVVEPIWHRKTETAGRVRQRIESILDWATVRDFRAGENPARWRGFLQKALPARGKVRAVTHHPALPHPQLPAFIEDLRSRRGTAARALEFTILTATRTNETLQARWSEFDLDEGVWTIPAARMKASREHRVPLAPTAMGILRALQLERDVGEWVFPAPNLRKPLSSMSMLMVLRRMQRHDLTVHGFRSTFRDWAAEQTNFPREVAEAALAHANGDKVEAAYRRSDLFDKRRKLMEAWACYCSAPQAGAEVVTIRKSAA